MISIGTIASASGAANYYAKDNYYAGPEAEAAGQWFGSGADKLGLTGRVATEAFEAVLAGNLPGGSEITTPSGAEHRAGLDLVFSAPKSLSLLALVGGDQRLVAALQDSARATLGWVEKNLIEARQFDPATGTQSPVKTGNMVAATFTHDLSRNRDPQLHVHGVIANATLRPDGAWRAVKNDQLYDQQATIASVHNADLRARVEALGYRTVAAENPRHGQFEIADVSRATIVAFSTRSAEIDAAIEAAGRSGSSAERELAALSTRAAKDAGATRDTDRAEWAERAAKIGFEPKSLVEAAMARAERGETLWSRVVVGVRGIAAKGHAVVAAMGLAPQERDPLVPERGGALSPGQYAAAQAVAAGVRHLSQTEAGFSRLDLIRASLNFGGPIGVADIEARVDLLAAKNLLLTDPDGAMMTTRGAVALEQQVRSLAREGHGQGAVLIDRNAGVEVQREARELGLRRLSPKQQAAAALILSSKDRIVAVQGVAGAGKSTMLQPVTRIASAQGRNVVALAVGAEIARKLGDDLGVSSKSVAAFLYRHQALLIDDGAPGLKERSVKELSHAVVIVDEASTLSSRQAADLMRVAHAAGVAKLALVGDVRQYGAVEAGKPFADLQKDVIATAELTENVRARSDIMKRLAPALDVGDHKRAFRILEPVTHQVPRGDATAHAVAMWAQRPPEEREQTLILTSGRALRTEANREAQSVLKAIGEIGQDSLRITVLDRINISREEARTPAPYREGRIVEIRADMPKQGLKRGMTGTVVGGHHGRVEIRSGDHTLTLRPERLARNLKDDAIALYAPLALDLHQNDKIRFTANNHTHGVLNAQTATVEKISDGSVTLKLGGDRRLELGIDDPALKRIDLGYAINTYAAQGVTTRHGIVIMDSREQMLTSSRTLGVALTRIADQPTLVVDSRPRVERAVERNSAEKTSALDVLKDQLGGPRKPGKDQHTDGIQRFGHNENQTFEKKDFEKERDYQKELEQLLGKQKSFELGIKNFDLGM